MLVVTCRLVTSPYLLRHGDALMLRTVLVILVTYSADALPVFPYTVVSAGGR